jgi:signal transduction histidine kinase
LDVRQRRLQCLNVVARELHADGVPFTPADLGDRPLFYPSGEAVKATDLPLVQAWRRQQAAEARFILPRGGERVWYVSWTATPVMDARGRVLGVVGTVTCGPPEPDTRKVAELAHDLRTPLQSLRLLCSLLERAPQANGELRNNLEALQMTADRAVQVALDLLECCRGPAKKAAGVEFPWFALEPFLLSLAAEQNLAAESKGLTLATHVRAVQGWEIHTDRVRLGRLLANLLTNAVRYTPRGRIDFTASWREEAGRQQLVLSVVDTGTGISQEEQESIFQPFERGQAGRESDSGGSGLGLAVVDRLVEELGLDLEVYSEYGRGSSFELLVRAEFLRLANGCGETQEL